MDPGQRDLGRGALGLLVLALLTVLTVGLLPGAARAQNGVSPSGCAYVGTLSIMASHLRSIDRAPTRTEAAPHLRALRARTDALTPDMLRRAGQEAALAPHAGEFAAFVAGTARFLAEGGHPRAVPGLERVSRLGAALACPPPEIRRTPVSLATGPAAGGMRGTAGLAPLAPQPLASSAVFGTPRQRAIFYMGALLLAGAIVVVHLRNQRYARLSARYHCHIETRLRQRGAETGTVVQDLSRMGATVRGGSLRIGDRLWLQLGRTWLSGRVTWRTRHFAGLGFDHPLDAAQLDRALAPRSEAAAASPLPTPAPRPAETGAEPATASRQEKPLPRPEVDRPAPRIDPTRLRPRHDAEDDEDLRPIFHAPRSDEDQPDRRGRLWH